MPVTIDRSVFRNRVQNLFHHWKATDTLNVPASVYSVCGAHVVDRPYRLSAALHFWLFGYEFTDTLIVLFPGTMRILTSSKKADILVPLKDTPGVAMEILVREKGVNSDVDLVRRMLDGVPTGPVGLVSRNEEGDFARLCIEQLDPQHPQSADSLLCPAMASKDLLELKRIKVAAQLTTALMSVCHSMIERAVDRGSTITQGGMSEKIMDAFDDQFVKKHGGKNVLEEVVVEAHPAVVQTRNFTLGKVVEDKNTPMDLNCIYCSVGARYFSYATTVGRTFFVDASETQKKQVTAVHEAAKRAAELLRAGARLCDVYRSVRDFVSLKDDALATHFPDCIGSTLGLLLEDPSCEIRADSEFAVPENAAFDVRLHFILDGYAIGVSNTVCVEGGQPVELTGKVDSPGELFMQHVSEDERIVPVPSRRMRTRRDEVDETVQTRRREHQRELLRQLREECLAVFKTHDTQTANEKIVPVRIEAYTKESQLPSGGAGGERIVIDKIAGAVVVPAFGMPLVLHLSTIKNVSRSEESGRALLRINMNIPAKQGSTGSRSHVLKTLTVKSGDSLRMQAIHDEIVEAKRALQVRETENQQEILVAQPSLVEASDRRLPKLTRVFIRPSLEARRVVGEIEIHQNGLRFVSVRGESVNLLFSNVKHVFFQPCDGEEFVLVHFRLKNEIAIRKKRTLDVQFYRDVVTASADDSRRAGSGRYGDKDEILQEQEERLHRQKCNEEFQRWCLALSQAAGPALDVEIPVRKLGFYGVPTRQNVFLVPTPSCLVFLVEMPFFVVTLREIEVAHFERIDHGLKNFDLVFVFRDHSVPPLHINTINATDLERLRAWLDSMDIAYIESKVNYRWPNVMKMINEDPYSFYEVGGWAALQEGNEDAEVSDETSTEESVFSIEEKESESDSEFDEDESASDEEDGSEEEGEEEEDSSATEYSDDSGDSEEVSELEPEPKKRKK